MAAGQKKRTQEDIMQKTAEYAARKLNQKRNNVRVPGSTEALIKPNDPEIVEMVQKAYILFNRPHAGTDEEVCAAFNWYFTEYLPQTGVFPTVEGLAASCGITTVTLLEWAKSNDTRSCIVQKAKQILSELDAQLVQNGKIPQVVYIFRAKNFHGMQDAVKVEHVSTRPDAESPESLASKYADAIPVDFTENDNAES